MSDNEGKEPKVSESEKLLAQINAMKKGTPPSEDVKKATDEKPKEPEPTPAEKAPQPTLETQPAPKGQAEETKAPADKKEGKPEVDIREWAKRKSINPNDTDSVLRAYREMERKLSQINATNQAGNVPRGTSEPPYQPAPVWQPQQPAYQPQYQPPQYPSRQQIIEQEAAKRGWTPEDFEKVLDLTSEVTAHQTRRLQAELQAKYDAQLAELNRGNKRNSEFNELMADPLFTRPEVAFEIDQIMAENPQRLKLEPTPWHSAFTEALQRIARRNLLGAGPAEDSGNPLPAEPPKSGGRGSTPGIPPTNAPGTVVDKFKRLSTKEMEEQLVGLGAIKPQTGASFE